MNAYRESAERPDYTLKVGDYVRVVAPVRWSKEYEGEAGWVDATDQLCED